MISRGLQTFYGKLIPKNIRVFGFRIKPVNHIWPWTCNPWDAESVERPLNSANHSSKLMANNHQVLNPDIIFIFIKKKKQQLYFTVLPAASEVTPQPRPWTSVSRSFLYYHWPPSITGARHSRCHPPQLTLHYTRNAEWSGGNHIMRIEQR